MNRKIVQYSMVLTLLSPIPAALAEDTMHADKHTGASMKETDAKKAMALSRASHVIGTNVYNSSGESLGEVHELVLDGGNNRVSYAVLSFGGWMGIGDKLFAIPYTQLQQKPIEKDKLYVNLSKDQLKNAPGFEKNAWPDKADADYWQQVNRFYADSLRNSDLTGHDANRNLPTDDRAIERGRGVNESTVREGSVPREDGIAWNRKVSQVIAGADVETPTGENLGDITDLVIGQDGQVRYAVLSYGGLLGMGDKLFAVPMNALKGQANDEQFTMNSSKEQLKNAPGFDKNNWPDLADAQWRDSVDRFYGQPAQARTE